MNTFELGTRRSSRRLQQSLETKRRYAYPLYALCQGDCLTASGCSHLRRLASFQGGASGAHHISPTAHRKCGGTHTLTVSASRIIANLHPHHFHVPPIAPLLSGIACPIFGLRHRPLFFIVAVFPQILHLSPEPSGWAPCRVPAGIEMSWKPLLGRDVPGLAVPTGGLEVENDHKGGCIVAVRTYGQ